MSLYLVQLLWETLPCSSDTLPTFAEMTKFHNKARGGRRALRSCLVFSLLHWGEHYRLRKVPPQPDSGPRCLLWPWEEAQPGTEQLTPCEVWPQLPADWPTSSGQRFQPWLHLKNTGQVLEFLRRLWSFWQGTCLAPLLWAGVFSTREGLGVSVGDSQPPTQRTDTVWPKASCLSLILGFPHFSLS